MHRTATLFARIAPTAHAQRLADLPAGGFGLVAWALLKSLGGNATTPTQGYGRTIAIVSTLLGVSIGTVGAPERWVHHATDHGARRNIAGRKLARVRPARHTPAATAPQPSQLPRAMRELAIDLAGKAGARPARLAIDLESPMAFFGKSDINKLADHAGVSDFNVNDRLCLFKPRADSTTCIVFAHGGRATNNAGMNSANNIESYTLIAQTISRGGSQEVALVARS